MAELRHRAQDSFGVRPVRTPIPGTPVRTFTS
jgi:hypothetical protein